MVGWGAITRKGRPFASRKRVTCAAASVVSPGGFGLFARTKSHRNSMILSRSSSIHLASCVLTSVMSFLPPGELSGKRIHRPRLDRRTLLLDDGQPYEAPDQLAGRGQVGRVHHVRSRRGDGLDLARPGEHQPAQRDVAGRVWTKSGRAADPGLPRPEPPEIHVLRAGVDGRALAGRSEERR